VRIATVNQEETTLRFVADLEMLAKDRGIRFTTDNSSVSVGKKIRSAETAKVPYTLVIGDKEVAERQLTPRIRADLAVSDTAGVYNPGQFFNSIHNESRGRVSKSSL
jgi:threonyl-tRNA synthetase